MLQWNFYIRTLQLEGGGGGGKLPPGASQVLCHVETQF